jgi:hypothetical protein
VDPVVVPVEAGRLPEATRDRRGCASRSETLDDGGKGNPRHGHDQRVRHRPGHDREDRRRGARRRRRRRALPGAQRGGIADVRQRPPEDGQLQHRPRLRAACRRRRGDRLRAFERTVAECAPARCRCRRGGEGRAFGHDVGRAGAHQPPSLRRGKPDPLPLLRRKGEAAAGDRRVGCATRTRACVR